MAGTKIENALNKVTESIDRSSTMAETLASASDRVAEKTAEAGSMGIKGVLWNNLAQLTATTILSGAFLYLGREFIVQSREKDIMFREELKAIRSSQETRWEKTDATHGKAMEKMGNTVERATTALETAVREMKESNRMGKGGGGP